jgi:hypothetical protein
MKKLVIAANGHPRTNNDLLHLQDAIVDMGRALGNLCAGNSNAPCVISGCNIITPGSGGAGTIDITDGFIFANNEIFYFAGEDDCDETLYDHRFRVQSTFAANNPYLGKNIHNIRNIVLMIPPFAFQAGDLNPNTVLANRAVNNFANQMKGSWVNCMNAIISLPQGDFNNSTNVFVNKDLLGRIQFSGLGTTSVGTFASGVETVYLPVGYRTSRDIIIPLIAKNVPVQDYYAIVRDGVGSPGTFPNTIIIKGNFANATLPANKGIYLSGINYVADL